MIRIFPIFGFLLCAVWITAGTAQAQTVSVRSGEHASFSRLVLTLPPDATWRLGRDGAGYLLRLDQPLGFDLDGVFDRLPAARIAAMTQQGPGALQILPGCACHLAAFGWEGNRLVIDVTDGPAPADSPFEVMLDPPAPQPMHPMVLPVLTPRLRSLPLFGLPDPFDRLADQAARLSEAGRTLREGVARAATQGLLQAEAGQPAMALAADVIAPADPAGVPVAVAEPDPAMAATMPTITADPGPQPGIAFTTAADRARDDLAAMARRHCLTDRQFDLANWARTGDFAAEIGRRRAAILSAEEQLQGSAVEDLARAYLHFGFGLEAEQALAMDTLRSADRRVLLALARLVDGRVPDTGVLDGQADCAGPVALWTALANRSVTDAGAEARIAIEAAHRALPLQLRTHLAAPLAEAFLAAGDAATAEAILAATDLALDTPPLAVAVTRAEVELVREGPDRAIATLAGLAASDDRMTAEALARLMELTLAQAETPGVDTLALSEAMRFEARGSEAAFALLAAEIRANIRIDNFDRALILLDEDSVDRADAALRGEVAIAMAARASPARFVEAAYGPLSGNLSAEAENQVAARLLALGFAERAMALVAAEAEGPAMAERRYLRAEAALALGRTLEVEAALTGLADRRADQLRQAARAREGDHAGALALAGAAAAPALAWRAGNWSALEAAEIPLLTSAAAARLDPPIALTSAQPLAARSDLLTQAEATRALAEELLTEFADLPPGQPDGTGG